MDRINYLITKLWCYIKNNTIKSIVAGDNITVDNSDPQNPVISSTGGGGSVTDQDNIPVFVTTTLAQIGSSEEDTDLERKQKFVNWILAQEFTIGEKEIWYFQLERENNNEDKFIPLAGTEEDSPVTGTITLKDLVKGYETILSSSDLNIIAGNGDSAMSYTGNSLLYKSGNIQMLFGIDSINTNDYIIRVGSPNLNDPFDFRGLNYNPSSYVNTSYIQKQYVDDRFTNNSTELVSADYGTTTNILKSTQFFTTGDGTGITTLTLDPSIPIGSLLFVSDWGNEAEMNNIVVDAGSGNNILRGDGSGMINQVMEITSSGLSYTLRKLTTNNWMVIGTNQ